MPQEESNLLKIWYVAPQRLCNFRCSYCVSTGDWAKCGSVDWTSLGDLTGFRRVVHWIGSQPAPVGVRLASLGEPFSSNEFLDAVAWLGGQSSVNFIELVTNASLLRQRLKRFDLDTLSKLTLWCTYHHSEIGLDRFVENIDAARQQYNCRVIVNALLFKDNREQIKLLRERLKGQDYLINIDLGYDVHEEHGTYMLSSEVVSIEQELEWRSVAAECGVREDSLQLARRALNACGEEMCAAGSDYLFIGIDGAVYPCSRYYDKGIGRLGNIVEGDLVLPGRAKSFKPCLAGFGCSNKEDYLNMARVASALQHSVPSLGWLPEEGGRPARQDLS